MISAQLRNRVETFVWFTKPNAREAEVRSSALWRLATEIPGVVARFDREEAMGNRFRARVSGQLLLYSPSGTLLFNGGITAARGHIGGNAGADAVLRSVNGQGASANAPVFGCSLLDPDAQQLAKEPQWRKP
jgi:hypothetical protein